MDKKEFTTAKYFKKIQEKEIDWETNLRINITCKLIGKNKKVLDLGCKEGFISQKIKDYGNDVQGIELSKNAARVCNERGIKCYEQDIEEKFPFENGTFDVVYAGEIIEHIFDTDSVLQEIRRVLKPGGELILTTPNIAALTRRLRLLFGINPAIEIGLIALNGKKKGSGHIRYFTIGSLQKLLKRNNFTTVQWKTDFIMFHKLRLVTLGKILPSLGYGLYVKAKKE